MEDLLAKITDINEYDIDRVLTAVLAQYHLLYPDWEINILSVPKYGDRNQQIDRTIALLNQMKQ